MAFEIALLYFIIPLITFLLFNTSYFIRWYNLRGIPIVGPKTYVGWLMNLAASRRSFIALGYKKHSQSLYRLFTLHGELLIVPPKFFDELKIVLDSKFSFDLVINIALMPEYTKAYIPDDVPSGLIKMFMGPKAGAFLPEIFEESKYVLKQRIPVTDDWTPISFFSTSSFIIASVAGVLLGGPELNRNEEWLQSNIDYVVNVMQGAIKISMVPWILRPIGQYLIKELYLLPKITKTAYRLAAPVISKRAESIKTSQDVQHNDFLQQLLLRHPLPTTEADLKFHVHCHLVSSLGTVLNTSMSFVQVVYDLAYRPEYMEELRAEAREFLKSEGPITKQKIGQLQKLDSFLKESQRLNPPIVAGSRRICTAEHTFSDGTFIPVGAQIGLPTYDMAFDSSLVNATEFDGFRWYKLRESSSARGLDFSATTRTSIHFGTGKHSCGGRFFVADLLKTLIVVMITTYDLRLKEPEKGRPKNLEADTVIVPNIEAQILFRKATA